MVRRGKGTLGPIPSTILTQLVLPDFKVKAGGEAETEIRRCSVLGMQLM